MYLSHCRVKALSSCREYFPLSEKFMASLCGFLACASRILAMVLYFGAPLGLFSLLRHLQGEMIPWNAVVYNYVRQDGKIFFDKVGDWMNWTDIDRWERNPQLEPFVFIGRGSTTRNQCKDPTPATELKRMGLVEWNPGYLVAPPNYTLYTGLRLRYFYYIFVTLLCLHILINFIAKYNLSEHFVTHFNLFEKLVHCLENTNIAYNAQEWDDAGGNAKEHKMRMRSNLKEVVVIIWIKTFFNLIFLMPMCYLGKCCNL